jgi:pimeloyl-ACP methyl ester carboxylesterase
MAPPLVLLPAMLCDERLYRSQAAALRDLVEPLPLIVAEADLALAVDVVLREAPTRFVLAGTSYGGNLALEVARAAPARVLGLWLMGCNPGLPGDLDAGRSRSRRVQAGEFEAVLDELASGIVYPDGPRAAAAGGTFRIMARSLGPTVFLRQNTSLLGRPDRRDSLAGITCPTLLLWGRQDEFCGLAHASLMASRIPRSDLVVLDECGHLPTLEQPEAATDAARSWLLRAIGAMP